MKKRSVPLAVKLLRTSIRILGTLAPFLAASWVYKLWFTTPRYAEPVRERRWREQAELQYLQIDGDRIAVYRWGDDTQPRVYLVHGWSGRGAQLGAFVKPLNELGYTVISFDALGHGLSSGNSANIFKITSHLQSIIHHFGEPAHIIAHSFGSMVSALLIRKYKLTPKSLVTISSPTRPEYLLELFTGSLQLNDRVKEIFNRKLTRDFGDNVYQEIAADENLRGNPLSAMIVHDKQDKEVNWQYSQKLLDVMPNAQSFFTEGLGHRRILRDKQTVYKIVRFIAAEDNLNG